MKISWAAILAATLMLLSLVAGVVAAIYASYFLLAMAGLIAANGVGWAVLALRDET